MPRLVSRRFRAPGRVNLMGDHTDYNDGFVLPMAIDRECVVTAAPRADTTIRAIAGDETALVAADGSDEPHAARPEWARYVAAVARVLAARGRAPIGVDAQIDSTVPVGSGLSSSAALEVALALALCDAGGLALGRLELALACQESEHMATGVPSGIMDQLSSLAGVAGCALLIDCRTLSVESVPLPDGVAVLAVHSGVARSLENSAYADRRRACDDAARRLGVRALRDATIEQVAGDPVGRHVVSENGRVHATAAALRAGDGERAGALFAASHASLRDDFRVSTPELDALVEALAAAGAYGARLTGAGFGGAVVALAADEQAETIAADACAAYARRTGRGPTAFRCVAVDGAGRVA
jgi:galactokinase